MTATASARPTPATIATLALVAAACLGTGLAVAPGDEAMGYDRFALPKELVAATTMLALAAARLLARRPLAPDGPGLCLVAVLALSVLSLAGAPNQLLGLRALGVIAVMVAGYALGAGLSDDGQRRAVCAIVAVTGAILAAVAIGEAHGLLPAWSMAGRSPGGTEGNRNFLAHGLAVTLPVAVTLAITATRRGHRRAAVLAIAVVVYAIVLSRSRGAWLGSAAALAVTFAVVAALARPRRALVGPAAGVALGVVAALAVPNRLAWESSSPYADTVRRLGELDRGSGRGRLIQYATTVAMIGDHPWLGVGPGNWSVVYPGHARPGDPSHTLEGEQPVNRLPNSDWLGAAAERGLPAVAAFLAFLGWLAVSTWRARRRVPAGAARVAALAGLIAVFVVGGSVDAVLLRPTPALLAALALGALGHRERRPLGAWSGPARLIAVAACLTLAVGVGWRGLGALRGAQVATAGTRAALERATQLAPGDYRITARLATIAARRRDCVEVVRWASATLASFPHHRRSLGQLAACRRRAVAAAGSR